ncbi:MAG: hypothetical protein FJ290_21095 [Planctomycetes bacterium]|nr:hypothetical protein [Planctomycetota bacterium]
MASSLAACYAFDRGPQAAANAEGRNYWYAYVKEILSRLGACAQPLPLVACAEPSELSHVGVLVLGDFPASALPKGAGRALAEWVAAGGVLIGFATEGLDGLFGVAGIGRVAQARGPFSINGYLELDRSPVTEDCRAPIAPGQRLIIVSPVRLLRPSGSQELARLFLCDPDTPDDGSRARDSGSPAITQRELGAGHAFYFAFDLAQTMWAIQQGRPVDSDYDGDGYHRASDACVLGGNSLEVPYADALHFLLANMIGRRPVPMVHQVPPRAPGAGDGSGRVAPALLCFGGDDEGQPENQVLASDFMAARGLPYHINAMPLGGRFALSRDEKAHIEANGHEVSLHYNFIDGFPHPCGFTREDVAGQARLFRETFGHDPVCSVMHWCRWTGWAEPARWIREQGGRADNSFIHWTSPPLNPTGLVGFAFGSAFPRHVWDDAAHANARLDFIEIPVVAYEVGYEGDECRPEQMRWCLELAARYRLTFDFFWHPIYIARYPACQKAVDELVRLIGQMPVPPVLAGLDEACRWWDARSKATMRNAALDSGRLSFEAECGYRNGFVIKVPTGETPARGCEADGVAAPFESAHEFGQHWAFIPLPPGRHVITLGL